MKITGSNCLCGWTFISLIPLKRLQEKWNKLMSHLQWEDKYKIQKVAKLNYLAPAILMVVSVFLIWLFKVTPETIDPYVFSLSVLWCVILSLLLWNVFNEKGKNFMSGIEKSTGLHLHGICLYVWTYPYCWCSVWGGISALEVSYYMYCLAIAWVIVGAVSIKKSCINGWSAWVCVLSALF